MLQIEFHEIILLLYGIRDYPWRRPEVAVVTRCVCVIYSSRYFDNVRSIPARQAVTYISGIEVAFLSSAADVWYVLTILAIYVVWSLASLACSRGEGWLCNTSMTRFFQSDSFFSLKSVQIFESLPVSINIQLQHCNWIEKQFVLLKFLLK